MFTTEASIASRGLKTILIEKLTWSVRNNVRQLPNGRFVRKNDTRFFGQTGIEEVARRIAEHWRAIPAVTCPTLVVRGALSEVFTDEAAARFAAALPNGRWLRIENAGHTVQGDNPAALIAALRPFLAGLPAAHRASSTTA